LLQRLQVRLFCKWWLLLMLAMMTFPDFCLLLYILSFLEITKQVKPDLDKYASPYPLPTIGITWKTTMNIDRSLPLFPFE
jgi:hypothetical protein